MDKKKMMEIVGSLFIALILVISYAASGAGNNNPPSAPHASNQSATKIPAAWYAEGIVNASISSYSASLTISSICNSSLSANALNSTTAAISSMGNSSTIIENQIGNNIFLQSFSASSIQIYNYLNRNLNASSFNCLVFKGSAKVLLPATIKLYAKSIYGLSPARTADVFLPNSSRIYSLPIIFKNFTNSTVIKVKVVSLLSANLTPIGSLNASIVG